MDKESKPDYTQLDNDYENAVKNKTIDEWCSSMNKAAETLPKVKKYLEERNRCTDDNKHDNKHELW